MYYKKDSARKTWNIPIDEKVCFNCKHRIWAVAIGAGIRCGKDMKSGKDMQNEWPKPIPGVRKSCEKFEISEDVKRMLQFKKANQLSPGASMSRIQEYINPDDKTFAEILDELTELQDAREDRAGAVMRIIQSQKGHAILTDEQELIWEVWNDLKKLIKEVIALKEWAED